MTRTERTTAPVQNPTQLEERDRQTRKIAIGRKILADGPISVHDIGRACAAAGAFTPLPDRCARNLSQPASGFLVLCPGVPRRYDLTARGRAWVAAVLAGEDL